MKATLTPLLVLAMTALSVAADAPDKEPGFESLFDGKTFDGWKVGKNAESFTIRDGMIVANGPAAHLFYVGDVAGHDFKNFDLKVDVMTFPHANSGIYFHTRYQEEGFPKYGLECQVNNSHKDWRRSGSLWGVKDVSETSVKDEVWHTQEIIVRGRHIVTKINGETVVDYTLPDKAESEIQLPAKKIWLPRGTFALQAHDPGSTVYFKSIRVKVLPD